MLWLAWAAPSFWTTRQASCLCWARPCSTHLRQRPLLLSQPYRSCGSFALRPSPALPLTSLDQ